MQAQFWGGCEDLRAGRDPGEGGTGRGAVSLRGCLLERMLLGGEQVAVSGRGLERDS